MQRRKESRWMLSWVKKCFRGLTLKPRLWLTLSIVLREETHYDSNTRVDAGLPQRFGMAEYLWAGSPCSAASRVWPTEARPKFTAPGQLQIPTVHRSCLDSPRTAGAHFSTYPPVTQSSAPIALHVLRPCLFSQIVTKGEAAENCIFLQRGDITCKSSEVNTQSPGSWSFSFTVPCLYIQRGPLQPLVTPVPLSDFWLGSGILLTLVSQPNEITPMDMLVQYC